MAVTDIHTHVQPAVPGSALVCIECGPLPKDKGHVFSVGLHPWKVTGQDDDSFRKLESLLALPQVLAVGECGFDTLKGPSHQLQEQAFVRQVQLSEHFRKPVILHVVRDFDSVIRLRKSLRPSLPWLIHGFRGGPQQALQLLANGLLVSFGPRFNPESVKVVPHSLLFLETDGTDSIESVICAVASARNETPHSIESLIQANNSSFISA